MSAPEPKLTLMEEAFGCIRIVKPQRQTREATPEPIAEPEPEPDGPGREELLRALRSMRLLGMAEELSQDDPSQTGLSFEQRMLALLEREAGYRQDKRQQTKLKKAGLETEASLDEIHYGGGRGLTRRMMEPIADCQWVDQGRDMLLCGPTGTGKTYLSNSLGRQAMELGHKVAYYRLPRLMRILAEARVTGGFKAVMDGLLELDLLIIDDWGWGVLSRAQRLDLLEIIESRHGLRSTLIASQLELDKWPGFIGDERVAESICDRMANAAHILDLKGSSLRSLGEADL